MVIDSSALLAILQEQPVAPISAAAMLNTRCPLGSLRLTGLFSTYAYRSSPWVLAGNCRIGSADRSRPSSGS
jgi:hypothetical protein